MLSSENNIYNSWQQLFSSNEIKENLLVDNYDKGELIISEMLLPDNINPLLFIDNLENWLQKGISILKPLPISSPSLSRFYNPSHIPPSFPLWFVIAYPDVLEWFQQKVKTYIKENGRDYDGLAKLNASLLCNIDINNPPPGFSLDIYKDGNNNSVIALKNLTSAYIKNGNKFETSF